MTGSEGAVPPVHAMVQPKPPKAAGRPKLAPDLYATCPMICMVTSTGMSPLPIHSGSFQAEVHISTAIVSVQMECAYPTTWGTSQLIFFFPKTHDTTISEITISNPVRNTMFATAIVPVTDVQKNGWSMSKPAGMDPQLSSIDLNDPELFTLFLPQAQPGDVFHVNLQCFLPLPFENGQYVLRLPTTLPQQLLSMAPANNLLDVRATLNTGVPESVVYTVTSHPHLPTASAPGSASLSCDRSQPWPNLDFEVNYQVWGEAIVASVNVQPPKDNNPVDPRGTFSLAAAPPAPFHTKEFSRSVLFLVDRSGSMDGEPVRSATAALVSALSLLSPADQFSICAFDHDQMWFTPHLMDASPANLDAARGWVQQTITARGGTDIMTPLSQSLDMLRECRGLPYVFLVTDGAVNNEREICTYVNNTLMSWAKAPGMEGMQPPAPRASPRVSTFAVGSFCNHFFLKQLATMARGTFDVAFRPNRIQAQMGRMMAAAARPVLTNITLEIQGLKSCELYPYPLPDLFCGQPLLVAGKYEGTFPTSIKLNGLLPSGEMWSQVVITTTGANMPLDKIFAKSQLDLLTATAWLTNTEEQQRAHITALSVAANIPCAYTRTVGFETTPEKYSKLQAEKAKLKPGKTSNVAKYAVAGAAGVVLLAGTAAILASGDIGATLANTLVGAGGLFGGLGDVDVGGCCDGCFDFDCGGCCDFDCSGCCDFDCGGCADCGDCGGCDIGDVIEGLCGCFCGLFN